ncbi:uracil-DNA glycosylase, mitochondrial [Cynara cardunculus var. scolymus]|uniref:Uracil-DNA glycosylase n=1 Tax=Cynara cardunculus var. scolymus TaxID=59895 RepID=A0A103YA16_CYNCS|nr:uracil-DNA glycosylase, mitochondrial [Cynara cardunculus var. scolymus]KVI05259.1 Uracil-DNA glycosylase [Cynara cardunculus var. scolymus]
MRSCINHRSAPFFTFPAIILHKIPVFLVKSTHNMASSKAITDFFPPAKRSKAASSFEPSLKRNFLDVPQKPTTDAVPSSLPESIQDDEPTTVQTSPSSTLTAEQKLKVQFNQSLAKAKRNLRICAERVSNSTSGEGLRFLKLQELLVEETWLEALPGEFQKPYAKKLSEFIESEIQGPIPIYPPQHLIFNALNSTPFDKIKAVIIGQDPYHGPGQAMGLSFSVPQGIKVPSSLVNIYKELHQDLNCSIPSHGNLERWAIQGVLLLNAVLTVRQHQANSHAKKGWEQFTDSVIETISKKNKGIVFLLWGNYAQAKSRLIDETKHHILKAAHPSGLSAHRGFFGCRHFSRVNRILEEATTPPINWQL